MENPGDISVGGRKHIDTGGMSSEVVEVTPTEFHPITHLK